MIKHHSPAIARATRRIVTLLTSTALAFTTLPATAEEHGEANMPWFDNDVYKVSADVRARLEIADFDGASQSEAYTIRPRIGVGTKPIHGISTYLEGEGVLAFDDTTYFDGASPNPKTQSLIADPEDVQVNQAWVRYERATFAGFAVKAGRQRLIRDDARFLGNVGWRQNEQTYDAVQVESSLGVDDLTVEYAHIWDVRRVFGNHGPTSVTQDFDSESHLARVHYSGLEIVDVTAFAYWLDFEDDAPAFSSNTYGFRAETRHDLTETARIDSAFSYAYQLDADDNPVDYSAHYIWASLAAVIDDLGTLSVAYEMLGSDDGDARFVTPLATAHKFNGHADAFTDNGGPDGLQDLMITVSPKMPAAFSGAVSYHEFWSEDSDKHLGREVDVAVSRSLTEYLTALTKFAWFDGDVATRADRWRYWFELTFRY